MGMNDQTYSSSSIAGTDRNNQHGQTYVPKSYIPVNGYTQGASQNFYNDSQGSYQKFNQGGQDYYYMQDPMQFKQNKQGKMQHYTVPNLYLAYRGGVENSDQYVKPASALFGNQQKKVRGNQDGQQVMPDQSYDIAPEGYLFTVDPFSYGAQSYSVEKDGTWDSFTRGLVSLLGVAAAPLTAGLSQLFGVPTAVAGAGVGAARGALGTPDNPLLGAAMGGGAGLAPMGLNAAGVSNPVVQGALIGGGMSALTDENPLLGAGMGAISGGAQLAQQGVTDMGLFDSLSSGGGTGLKMGGGGSGSGFNFDFMDDMDFGGGGNFGSLSNMSSNQFGGSGQGLKMPNFDFGSQMPGFNLPNFQSGQGLQMGGGASGLKLPEFGPTGMPSPQQQGGGMNWQGALKDIGGVLGMMDKLPIKEIVGGLMERSNQKDAMQRYQRIAEQSAAKADPFAGQRAQYQTQLSNLMQNPQSIEEDPSYKFRYNQGLEALRRMNSARGYNDSGNEMIGAMEYGQGMASQELEAQLGRLAQLAGGNFGPGYAGNVYGSAASQGVGANSMRSYADSATLRALMDWMAAASTGKPAREAYKFGY